MKSHAFPGAVVIAYATFFSITSPVAAQVVMPGVVNPAKIKSSGSEVLRNAVRRALESDGRVPSRLIAIMVQNNEAVVLFGTVQDEDSKQVALDLARRVPGVRNVLDKLKVGPAPVHVDGDEKDRIRASQPDTRNPSPV